MTKTYSKISGYDRPHVYVFVWDQKISTLESVFKNFRIRPENTLDTCGRCLKVVYSRLFRYLIAHLALRNLQV